MKIILTLILVAIFYRDTALAATKQFVQSIENNWEICPNAVHKAERASDIPPHLLNAIARAETGRWNSQRQANIAWPWTVTAQGKGQFFDTKDEAIAETELLLTKGIRNIDVGCMQINLMYHSDAFESLKSAFDPFTNAQYGAYYLRVKYNRTKDWLEAAAHYHSTTPTLSERYKAKITHLWSQAKREQITALALPLYANSNLIQQTRTTSTNNKPNLTDQLNEAFRTRLKAKTSNESKNHTLTQGKTRRAQLDAWRQNKSSSLTLVNLALMRRLELAQQRAKKINRRSAGDRVKIFAQRRRQELAKWNATRKKLNDILPKD